jgi:hypothetical protein
MIKKFKSRKAINNPATKTCAEACNVVLSYNKQKQMPLKGKERNRNILIFGEQDMEKGGHEQFTEFCPCTLPSSPTKRHEILGYKIRVHVLCPICRLKERVIC